MQAIAFVAATWLVELTPQHWLTIVFAGSLLAWWLFLFLVYRSRRPEAKKGNRIVAAVILIATLLPLITAIGFGEDSVVWRHLAALTIALVALASLWLVMLASTLVDWYYVYPRRDGLVGDPPCRGGRHDHWTRFTRLWYAHRAVAGIAGTVAVIVATTAFTMAAIQDAHLQDAGKAGSLLTAAATGLALTRLVYGNLTTLGQVVSACCLSPPDIVVGDRLEGPADFRGGYVRDVALEGITVVRLGKHDQALYGGRLKRHGMADVLDKPDIEGRPFAPCSHGCRRINPNCQWPAATSETNGG
jgi:hypothetical protein